MESGERNHMAFPSSHSWLERAKTKSQIFWPSPFSLEADSAEVVDDIHPTETQPSSLPTDPQMRMAIGSEKVDIYPTSQKIKYNLYEA